MTCRIILKPVKEKFTEEFVSSLVTPINPHPKTFHVEQVEIHDDDPYDSGRYDMRTIAPMAIVHIDLFYPSDIHDRLSDGELVEVELEVVE